MRSLSQTSAAPKHRGGAGGPTLQAAATVAAERVSTVRLGEDVLFAQPVVLGGLSIIVVASARTVRAVLLTNGGTTLSPPRDNEWEGSGNEPSVLSTSDLAGSISAMHVISLSTASGGHVSVHRALVAVGTTHGTLRILCLEGGPSTGQLQVSFRTVTTIALADVSSNQIGTQDTVVSVAWICPPAASSTSVSALFPDAIFAASRRCVLGLSLGGLESIVCSNLPRDVSVASPFTPRRTHCSIHNDSSIVRVIPLPPASESVGGQTSQYRAGAGVSNGGPSASSSSNNTVADHCLACVVVQENGTVKYLIRCLSDVSAPPPSVTSSTTSTRLQPQQHRQLSFAYRLCPNACTALTNVLSAASASNHSVMVVNDASFEYDELANALNLVLCGVQLSDPATSSVGAKGATPTTGGVISLGGGRNDTLGAPQSSMILPSSSSFFTGGPSGSQYAFGESSSPYAHKVAWWGALRSVVPLSQNDLDRPEQMGNEEDTATRRSMTASIAATTASAGLPTRSVPHNFSIPVFMRSEQYIPLIDTVVSSWADGATALMAQPPLRQSTTTPVDRRGFASCSVFANHTALLSMGCELHLGMRASSSSTAFSEGSSGTLGLSAPQSLYTFATVINTCMTLPGVVVNSNNASSSLQLGGAISQRFLVGSGNSLHILLLAMPR